MYTWVGMSYQKLLGEILDKHESYMKHGNHKLSCLFWMCQGQTSVIISICNISNVVANYYLDFTYYSYYTRHTYKA